MIDDQWDSPNTIVTPNHHGFRMVVTVYEGVQSHGVSPNSSGFIGFSIVRPSRVPYFWKHPYEYICIYIYKYIVIQLYKYNDYIYIFPVWVRTAVILLPPWSPRKICGWKAFPHGPGGRYRRPRCWRISFGLNRRKMWASLTLGLTDGGVNHKWWRRDSYQLHSWDNLNILNNLYIYIWYRDI